MTDGVAVLVVVLLAATAFGLYRRRTDGRMRAVAGASTPLADDGRAHRDPAAAVGPRDVLDAVDLGSPLGPRATLVQFSTSFCQPCRATRVVLGEVAGMVDGVAHVEVDAEANLDLVRRLDIMRTPTVLVLDAAGRVVRRAVGAPRKADVIAALGEAVR